jgi:hypothetical protein
MATIPSLALIPSGYKASKVYSVLPTDGIGDFTFTRSGNATRVNSEGLIELVSTNVPRLNYPLIDGVVQGCPSLLLEPSRINLVQYSESFSNAYWTKTNSSITSNAAISPDGTLNADKLVESTSASEKLIQRVLSVTTSTIYTASVFVKYAGREWIRFTDAQSSNRIHFNTLTGAFGSITGVVINYKSIALSDGWYKLSITTTSVAAAYAMRITLAEADNDVSYTGDGTSGVYIYGAQLEVGSYPTSYIVSNSGSATTRVAETANNSGDDQVINSTEGVLYVEMNAFDGISRISLSDGNTNNRVSFRITDDNIDFQYRVGGSYSYRVDVDVDNSNTNKMAMSFNNGVFVGYLNGFAIGSPISGTSLSQGVLDRLNFNDGNSSDSFEGNIKEVKIYNTALNDSDLETLTSWDSFSDMATSQLYSVE